LSRFIQDMEAFFVAPETTIRDAVKQMDRTAHGIVLVVDASRHLAGTITDGDVRRAMLAGLGIQESVERLLDHKSSMPRHDPITAPLGMSDADLLHLMNEKLLRHIPLLDETGRVVDIALLSDLAKEYEPQLQAVVMAGGFGARLRPLTEDMPKPMLPVGGRPLMERTIEKLKDAGVTRVNITTHFRPEKIVEHFGQGDGMGVDLNYVNEDQPLGTAGALGLLEEWQEPLLVINGDILTTVDFRAMLDFHRNHESHLTVAVRHYEVPVPYGVIECDGVDITGVREKPNLSFFVNAGIYLIEPDVRDHIPGNEKLDMTDLIERLIGDGMNVVSFPIREYWLDIGEHEDYLRAQEDVEQGRFEH